MSKIIDFFSKLLLVVANLSNLPYCANKFVRTVLTVVKNYYSYSCKFMQLAIFANRFVCTALADLQTQFCKKLIYMYV